MILMRIMNCVYVVNILQFSYILLQAIYRLQSYLERKQHQRRLYFFFKYQGFNFNSKKFKQKALKKRKTSVFDESFFHFRTFHCFDANAHFDHMSRFGTCSAFVTFLTVRFDSRINYNNNKKQSRPQ